MRSASLVATFAVSTALYGPVDIGVALVVAAGVVASVAFIVAVILAVSTAISNQPAVAAIGFGVFFLPQLIAGLIPATSVRSCRPRSWRGRWASRPAPTSGS